MKCSYPGYCISPVNGWLYSTYRWPVLYQAEAILLKWRDGVKYRINEIQPSEAKLPQALSAKKRAKTLFLCNCRNLKIIDTAVEFKQTHKPFVKVFF
jgi:hypothetical protein